MARPNAMGKGDYQFCTKCGNDTTQTTRGTFCPYCGGRDEGKRFCSECGSPLHQLPSAESLIREVTAAPAATAWTPSATAQPASAVTTTTYTPAATAAQPAATAQPTTAQAGGTTACPVCNQSLMWVPQYSAWWCNNCGAYRTPSASAAAPGGATASAQPATGGYPGYQQPQEERKKFFKKK